MQLNPSLMGTDSLLVPSEFSRQSQWFHRALADGIRQSKCGCLHL